MWTLTFLKLAAERAAKTAAQSALLVLGADQINAIAADWGTVGGFALGGAVLSLLTSVVSAPFGQEGTPSLVDPTPDTTHGIMRP